MGKKRKAGALALLSGYASGSDGGGSGSEDGGASSSSSSEHSEDAPVLGPAGTPPLSAPCAHAACTQPRAADARERVVCACLCVATRVCVFCAGPPPRDAAAEEEGPSVGPSWRPADGEYEELPEAPPEEEEEEEAAAGAVFPLV